MDNGTINTFKEKIKILFDDEAISKTVFEILSNELDECSSVENSKQFDVLKKIPAIFHSINESGHIIDVSDYWLKGLGYEQHEVIGKKSTDFLTTKSKEKAISEILPLFYEQKYLDEVDYEFIHKSGKILNMKLSAILLNERMSFAVLRDVTEELKNQNEVERLTMYLEGVINSMPSTLIGINDQFEITLINKFGRRLLTKNDDKEVLGKYLFNYFDLLKDHKIRIQECIKNNTTFSFEEQATKNNKLNFYEVKVFPMEADVKHDVIIKINNITKRKEIEAQLAQKVKMEAVGLLAGGVAHDFNNVLTGILNSVELMKYDEGLNKHSLKALGIIENASNRAAELIKKLLDYSRKGKFQSIELNLIDEINVSLELVSSRINKNIIFDFKVSDNDFIIKGDKSQIQNIFINLFINAFDAMPNGGTLSIATKSKFYSKQDLEHSYLNVEPGHYVLISINDTGHGMTKEVAKKVFDPFFTTKQRGKGTGLGLSSVQGAVKEHCGEIVVYSELNIGTTFNVLLPLSENAKLDSEVNNNNELIAGNQTILVIDDEEIIRVTTKILLEKLGFKVLLAEDGIKGIELFKSKSDEIDLVILDMIMPQMNGKECYKKLKELNSEINIIVTSGFTESKDISDLNKIGLTHFIPKPFTLMDLSEVLKEVVKS